jgi:hypothetical protein
VSEVELAGEASLGEIVHKVDFGSHRAVLSELEPALRSCTKGVLQALYNHKHTDTEQTDKMLSLAGKGQRVIKRCR